MDSEKEPPEGRGAKTLKVTVGGLLVLLVGLVGGKAPGWVGSHMTTLMIAIGAAIASLAGVELFSPKRRRRLRTSSLLAKPRGLLGPFHGGRAYWGTAPARVELVGRSEETAEFCDLLQKDLRAIGVFGPPGVGKTSLVANVARAEAASFDFVLWHSLQNAPPAEEVLNRWLAAVDVTPQGSRISERIDLLISFAASKRCLIVFDNAETVFSSSQWPGADDRAREYGEIIDRLMANSGRSILVVTSIVQLLPFRSIPLAAKADGMSIPGLGPEAVLELLRQGRIVASMNDARRIAKAYDGNPQAILIVADYARHAYSGSLTRLFEAEGHLVNFARFGNLLERQLAALSPEEHELVLLMAVWREPIVPESLGGMLQAQLGVRNGVSPGELVTQLKARHLAIETTQGVALSAFLLEMLTNHITNSIAREIVDGQATLMDRCPLAQASWPDNIRQLQTRYLLLPIMQAVETAARLDRAGVHRLLRSRLRQPERGSAWPNGGFAVANILFLLEASGDELTDLTLDDLLVRGADFRKSWLRRTSLKRADVGMSMFAQCFGPLHAIAVSPDSNGRHIAGGSACGRVIIWDRATGEVVAERQSHSETVRSICFSPEGDWVFSGAEDCRLVGWRIDSGNAVCVEGAHGGWVWRVGMAADHGWLITTGGDGRLKVWDSSSLQELASINVPSEWVWGFAESGDYLAACGEDGSLWSWRGMRGGSERPALGDPTLVCRLDSPIKALVGASSEPGLFIVGCGDGRMFRVRPETPRPDEVAQRHRGAVRSLALVGEESLVASAGDDGAIRLWRRTDGEAASLLEGHSSRIWSLAAHRSLPVLVSAGDDRSARIWRVGGSSYPERTLYGVEFSVRSLEWDAKGRLVAACCDDSVRRWDIGSDAVERLAVARRKRLTIARTTGNCCVVAGDDGMIRVFGEGAAAGAAWKAHEGGIESLRVHRGLGLICSGGEDRIGRVWSLDGERRAELKYHRNRIWDVAFSPSGGRIVTGGGDHQVAVWTANSSELVGAIRAHDGLVLAVAWINEQEFVSGGSDGTLRFWRFDEGRDAKLSLVRDIDLGLVIREIVFDEIDRGVVLVAGRTREPERGSHVICLDRHGDRRWEVTGTIAGAAYSVAVDEVRNELLVAGDGADIVRLAWPPPSGEKGRIRVDGPYYRASFAGVVGLSEGQRRAIRELGGELAD